MPRPSGKLRRKTCPDPDTPQWEIARAGKRRWLHLHRVLVEDATVALWLVVEPLGLDYDEPLLRTCRWLILSWRSLHPGSVKSVDRVIADEGERIPKIDLVVPGFAGISLEEAAEGGGVGTVAHEEEAGLGVGVGGVEADGVAGGAVEGSVVLPNGS